MDADTALAEVRRLLPNMEKIEAEIKASSDEDLVIAWLNGMIAMATEVNDGSDEYLIGRMLFLLIEREMAERGKAMGNE